MLPHLRQVRLCSLAFGTPQSPATGAAGAQALRSYTSSLIPMIENLQVADGCSTSGCSCSHGSSCSCRWRLPPYSAARGSNAQLAAAGSFGAAVGPLKGALAQLRDAVQTTFAAAAVQIGLGRWAGGSGDMGGGLLLARRLPTEPEPFEDEYDDDEYEDGEFVDLDDEDLMGDLGEVEDTEAEKDGRRYGPPDEEEEDGLGEEEDDDDEVDEDVPAPPMPPPPGPAQRRTFWR